MALYPELIGKVVLITGGAQGIGQAMVHAFALQGASVYFCDVDETAAAKALEVMPPNAVWQKVDLNEETSLENWIQAVTHQTRRIDILINNAARDPRIPLAKVSAKDWDDLFGLNLKAYFFAIQKALPWIPAHGGSIINFSSLTFHTAPVQMSTYVATKGGVHGLTRALARELGPKNIRVNTLSPGWIMTERQLRQFVTPKVKKLIRSSQCIPELLTPQDIAEVALFLGSNSSRAITGQELLADRGWAFS